MRNITRKSFIGGMTATVAMGGGGCASVPSDRVQRMPVPADDWNPSVRWRGFNLLGMFRCPTIGLKPDPRVDGHFVEDGATGPNKNGGDNAVILPEFKFDAKTPPMFMLHGDKDYYSPMASVLLYTELHKRKIPAQLFVYANASHGLGGAINVKGWQ